MSILVVDDEAEIRNLLNAVLTDEGYRSLRRKMAIRRWPTSTPRRPSRV